jgi:hypothetical protein
MALQCRKNGAAKPEAKFFFAFGGEFGEDVGDVGGELSELSAARS